MRRFLVGLYAFTGIHFVAPEFLEPSSATNDFYTSYSIGEVIDVQWNSGWSWGKGTQPDFADLFIMWFDYPTDFSQLVYANVSLKNNGHYQWTVDVPQDKVASNPKFVFRFSQHTDPPVFNPDNPKMPSRGIILLSKSLSNASSSPSSLPSSMATIISASASSPLLSSSTGSFTSAGPGAVAQGKGSSNTGAIAGGVLGGLAGLALIFGAALILLRRVKKQKKGASGGGHAESMGEAKGGAVEVYAHVVQELPTKPSELSGSAIDHSVELHGSTPREWH